MLDFRKLSFAIFAATAVSPLASAAPRSLNLQATLAPTKALLSGGESADILVLGDSLSFRDGSYLPYFRSLLQTQYGNAGYGYQGYSVWSGAGFNGGYLGGKINEDITPHRSLDGLWNSFNGGTGGAIQSYVYPQSPNVQLQYVTRDGGGSFQVKAGMDGEVVTTINTHTDGPAGVGTFNYTVPSGGQQVYTIQPVGGQFTILGQNTQTTTPGVRVHRAANGGWGINNFLQRDTTFDDQVKLLGTDLVMVWLGQNDQGETRTSYAAKLNLLVNRLNGDLPNAKIVLIGTYDQGSPNLAGLVEAMSDVAAARSLGFINIYEAAGNRAFFDANRYLDDGIHFNAAGGQYLGNVLFNAFQTNGASLVPEPVSLALPLLAIGALSRRRRQSA